MRKLLIAIVVSGIALLSCERRQTPVGRRVHPVPAASYTLAANRSAVPGEVNVTAVAPGGGVKRTLAPAELYLKNCVACHQQNGQGIPSVFPPLAASPYVVSDNTGRLAAIMIFGLAGPIKVAGTQYASAMPGVGAALNDEELAAIATYIRSNWGNSAPAVSPDVFAAARNKWGARGPFAIQELGEEG